jgi:AraC-like DNA-binding protein
MDIIRLGVTGARIIEAANSLSPNPFPHPDRIMKVHDILFLTRGAWRVHDEDNTYNLKAGDVLFLFAGRHHYGSTPFAPGTSWIFLHVKPNTGDRYSAAPSMPVSTEDTLSVQPFIQLSTSDHFMRGLFDEVVHCSRSSSVLNRLRAQLLVPQLFIELARRSNATEHSVILSPIRHIVDLIEKNPKKSFSLGQLGDKCGLCRRTLTKNFRAITGMSVRQYQLKFKMRLACSLFNTNSMISVRAASEELGFSDEFHFSRYFKKTVGVAPAVFKSSVRARYSENLIRAAAK